MKQAWIDLFRFLTFRLKGQPDSFWTPWHLLLAFLLTWAVGIGRHWDHPNPSVWKATGAGSILYIAALSFFIWYLAQNLQTKRWKYLHVFTLVGFTSPPGLIYSLPVEHWTDPRSAMAINLTFLLFVATWRVLLNYAMLRNQADLRRWELWVCFLFPIINIIGIIGLLNLGDLVMQGMAGIEGSRGYDPSIRIKEITVDLGYIAAVAFPILLISYLFLAIRFDFRKKKRNEPTSTR